MTTAADAAISRILVIEDDPDTASLIADVLVTHMQSVRVEVASSLAQAFAAQPETCGLVLCDFHLPDGTGLDALRRLKERNPRIAFILVTGEREVRLAVEAIRAGAVDYVVKTPQFLTTMPIIVEKNLEVCRIRAQNERLQCELETSLANLQAANAELARMVTRLEQAALTDSLTGLANRRHLVEVVGRMYAEALRYGSDLSCIMIDVDGFKQVNDLAGHQKGDETLRLVASIIRSNCREADIAVRYGGDEFVVLLPQTTRETARNLAARVQADLAATLKRRPLPAPVSLSVGIASVRTSHPESAEQLIVHADMAMYAAKTGGKDRIMLCEADGRSAVPTSPPRTRAA